MVGGPTFPEWAHFWGDSSANNKLNINIKTTKHALTLDFPLRYWIDRGLLQ